MKTSAARFATRHTIFTGLLFLNPDGDSRLLKTLCLTLAVISIIIVRAAYAGAIGMPKNTAKIGYGIGATYLSVDDPNGNTEEEWTALPVTLIHTDWLFRDVRYWSEIFYYTAPLDAAAGQVGQDVEHYGLRFSVQKSLRLTDVWAPWFGVGLGVSQATYTKRHTKDADGYLLEAYPDRDQTSIALLLNVVSEWPLTKNWDIAAKLEGSIPVDGDIEEYSALVSLLYRY